jgi:hypothetical protein
MGEQALRISLPLRLRAGALPASGETLSSPPSRFKSLLKGTEPW